MRADVPHPVLPYVCDRRAAHRRSRPQTAAHCARTAGWTGNPGRVKLGTVSLINETPPPGHPYASRVLVIEDAEAIRVALQSALGLAGHRVLLRDDGDHLETDLRTFKPDLVVLDVMLPGRDGFVLLDVVRGRPVCSPRPSSQPSCCPPPRPRSRRVAVGRGRGGLASKALRLVSTAATGRETTCGTTIRGSTFASRIAATDPTCSRERSRARHQCGWHPPVWKPKIAPTSPQMVGHCGSRSPTTDTSMESTS